MKAIIYEKYGPPEVLQVKEVEKPVPSVNEILVRIRATSVNYGDLAARKFKFISPSEFNMPLLFWIIAKLDFGLSRPKRKVLGSEFAGEVTETGDNVKSFKPGDQVFGYLGQQMGGYQQFLSVPENGCVTLKPSNLDFMESAVIPYGSIMAYGLLRNLKIKSGDKVLVIGAGGSIGSAAIQIAKHLGADVTGVCGTNSVNFVKGLGADKIIDYRKQNYTNSDELYDLIFDVLGKSSVPKCKKILKPGGVHFFVSFKSGVLFAMLFTSIFGKKKVRCSIAPGSVEDLKAVKRLIEEGKLKTIIDRSFSMEQIVEAHHCAEGDNKKAKIVILMDENNLTSTV